MKTRGKTNFYGSILSQVHAACWDYRHHACLNVFEVCISAVMTFRGALIVEWEDQR